MIGSALGDRPGHGAASLLPNMTERDNLSAALSIEHDDPDRALRLAKRIVEGTDFAAWKGGSALLSRLANDARRTAKRTARVAVVGSYTTTQFVDLLRLAAYRYGIHLETYEAGFDQYRQEILQSDSEMYRIDPDVVVLAVHDGAVELPDRSSDPEAEVASETVRWTALWRHIAESSSARVVQHNFVVRPDPVHGNLAKSLTNTRGSMIAATNSALAAAAGGGVAVVDCDMLASRIGKDVWLDDRYWQIAKQAVSLGALPLLARHTAAVIAAQLGLSHKVLVLDLDNTLWGGTIGDDGIERLALGAGSAAGEAYAAFQRYCKSLSERGVLLAVCSKNDPEVAREPFRSHPDMALSEDDIAAFVANWEPKPDNLRQVAENLDLGLDSFVFVDDNPAEREIVRQLLPEVEVVELPSDPSGYIAAIADSLLFEMVAITDEDRQRTHHYRARSSTRGLLETASSIEEFHASLSMEAELFAFDETHLPRVVQLVNKTNQFNLTTRRHGEESLRAYMADPSTFTLALRLRDRLADHGLIAAVVAVPADDAFEIDTWVMSCRVIGRTVERTVLGWLIDTARDRGFRRIIGRYIPTPKNALVSGLFGDLGFERGPNNGETQTWHLAVPPSTPLNPFIEVHNG